MRRTINLPLHLPTLIFSVVIVSLYVFLTQFVFAHGGDSNLIHACVRNNLPNLPNIRIVGENDDCRPNETAVDWIKGTNLPPFFCISCNFPATEIGNRFSDRDLTNSFIEGADFTNVNLSGSIFTNSYLVGSNLSGANLTNATGLDTADLTGVSWSNTICPDGTNSDNNGNTCEGHLTP